MKGLEEEGREVDGEEERLRGVDGEELRKRDEGVGRGWKGRGFVN